MANSQTCRAVCAANTRVEGSITCVGGLLVGVSYCLSSDEMVAENVTKVVGELQLEVASSVTVEQLTAAIATAFAVDPQHVLVFLESGSKRRLADAPHRFLSSTYLVEYEVAVPSDRNKEHLFSAAKSITDEASAVKRAFIGILETFGVKVFSVDVVQQAVMANAVVIRDSKKTIVKFPQAPEATSTAMPIASSEATSAVDMEALGGVIAAFLVGLIASVACYCCRKDCRSSRSESADADGMSHSLSENRH